MLGLRLTITATSGLGLLVQQTTNLKLMEALEVIALVLIKILQLEYSPLQVLHIMEIQIKRVI